MAIYTSGLICQLAIEGEDKVLSAIQIVDRVVVDLPEHVDPNAIVVTMALSCFAVLMFRSDGAESFEATFAAIKPDGTRSKETRFPVSIPGGAGGLTMRVNLVLDPRSLGLWWFEVFVNGAVALRLPLEIVPEKHLEGPQTVEAQNIL